jgi:hypothetical protein
MEIRWTLQSERRVRISRQNFIIFRSGRKSSVCDPDADVVLIQSRLRRRKLLELFPIITKVLCLVLHCCRNE